MVQDELSQNTDLDELENLSDNEEKIEKRRLRPLSTFFELDVSHRPTQAKDRISKKRIWRGVFLGFLLILLGFVSDFENTNDFMFSQIDTFPLTNKGNSFSASWLFVGLGLFLMATRAMMLFYWRDFFIGHKFAAVVIQKPFEHSTRMADSLSEYLGVRYRTRVINVLGLTSYTQHIIDLQHPNETKTILLYVSKNGENISKKWEELARQMQMPALFNTANGIIEIPLEDIQKALPELLKEGKVPVCKENLQNIPKHFNIVENQDFCQIDPNIRDSAFSVFSGILCFCTFFSILFFGFVFHLTITYLPVVLIALILFVLIPLALFFRRKRIVISSEGIRIKSRWLFFPSLGFLIKPEELEYIYVVRGTYNLKHTLIIGADGQTSHIGRGLPKEDLEWLRNFINVKIDHFICRH